jgi:sulfur-oxidizing protein SoxZ
MPESIRVRVARDGEWAEVKSLILHPMETGLRKDPATGAIVPHHHITRITCTLNGRPVMVAHCSTAVAQNPWLTFAFGGARTGDRFAVAWIDNLGESDSLEMVLD